MLVNDCNAENIGHIKNVLHVLSNTTYESVNKSYPFNAQHAG